MSDSSPARPDIGRLVALVARLRGPGGCPWDQEQTLADLRAYLVEEAHEAAATIDQGDLEGLAEELGDLLFQLVFACHLASEQEAFDLARVIDQVEEKMVARHPHVFGDETLPDAQAVVRAWEERKRNERATSVLEGIPLSLPALVAANRMTQRAASLGFDWSSPQEVIQKLREEMAELDQALGAPQHIRRQTVEAEVGDLFFTLVNLARHLGVDPEAATASANLKFRRRFQHVEARLAGRKGVPPLDEMEQWWEEAKALESSTPEEP